MDYPKEKLTAAFRILKEAASNATNHTSTTPATTTVANANLAQGRISAFPAIIAMSIYFALIMFFFLGLHCIQSKNPEQETTREAAITEPRRELSLPERITKITSEDRVQYYNSLFETNCNKIILTSDQIIGGNDNNKEETKNRTNLLISAASPDEEEEPSIYLSLDNVWGRIKQQSGMSGNSKLKWSSSAIIMSDKHRSGQNKTVQGNCIICFENFEAGDTIVYSTETKDCHHVYHKDCMVEYFVHQNFFKRQLKIGETDPSCPTCRQTFCKLLPIDIGKNTDSNGNESISAQIAANISSSSNDVLYDVELNNDGEDEWAQQSRATHMPS